MTSEPHILLVDDDAEIRSLVSQFLKRHAMRVDAVADGRALLQRLADGRFDAVILDVMLPGEDGLSLCRRVRAVSAVPIVMLTAVGDETDRIVGLELGADDYIAKPFNPRELLARLRAVLRRTREAELQPQGGGSATLTFAGWTLNLTRRELRAPDGALVSLTGGEFELLAALAQRPNRVLTRDQLLDLTKGRAAVAFDRSIDVQLSRLRRKIEDDPKEPKLIKTVRGGGYVFSAEPDGAAADGSDAAGPRP